MNEEQSNPREIKLMPQGLGNHPFHKNGIFKKSNQYIISFLSEPNVISAMLPSGFQQAGDPIVSVIFNHNQQVEFLGNGELNIMGIYVPVKFKGLKDKADGYYTLVLWENKTMAIILGREIMGSPKLYGNMKNPVFNL